MPRILHFSSGPDSWKVLLADPVKHWRTGYSARSLAYCWENADGFPPEVSAALCHSHEPLLAELAPLLAVPEFKVPLPGGSRASQNDIFVLARSRAGPVSIMVEGKVNESFGPTIDEWRAEQSPGKDKRFRFLLDTLGIHAEPEGSTRYQLLHRVASALITAEQFRAVAAIMLVHSFSQERTGWPDYKSFLEQLGVRAEEAKLQRIPTASRIPLFVAWVVGDPAFLKS